MLGRAVVGVGRLRVADQRGRPRGGRRPARDLRRDGGAAGRRRSACPRRSTTSALEFAVAYGGRAGGAHRAVLDREPRRARSCAARRPGSGSAPRSASACWSCASFLDGAAQGAVWALALALDIARARTSSAPTGWKLVPGHFAERHGLIIIIALGESIVAIGVGAAGDGRPPAIVVAAVLGIALAARCGGSTSTSSRSSRRTASSRPRSAASRTRWRATRTRSSTSRWSPGSCSSRSA